MRHQIKTLREASALTLRVWRESIHFFLSIELWLMVLVAGATVAGVWLTAMGDSRSLLSFGFAIAYVVTRTILHVKRIVSWPFI